MNSTQPAPHETEVIPADATVDALVQLSFRVHHILGRIGAEHDLSVVQIRMLGVLRDREPSMLALAGHLGLDKSSTTGLVSRAEKRDLVPPPSCAQAISTSSGAARVPSAPTSSWPNCPRSPTSSVPAP